MKLIVLFLSLISVSLSVSYMCKENEVMDNRSCHTQFRAVVGEYQNITMWLKPTKSSLSVVISDTLFAFYNRTITLGKSWFVSDSWNKMNVRILIKELSKSKYELKYFIDDNILEVSFPFEEMKMVQLFFGLKWKFNGQWNISTNFPCLNLGSSNQTSSFNATNATSVYNGTVSCSLPHVAGSFPWNKMGSNINQNCSCGNVTKSSLLAKQSPIYNLTHLCSLIKVSDSHLNSSLLNLCSMCNASHVCQKLNYTKPLCYNSTKPCPDISSNVTACLTTANLTKSNQILNVSSSSSCPNYTTTLSKHLQNQESHSIIYVALFIMVVGALSLMAGCLQYRKALRLRKESAYEEFTDDYSQSGTLESNIGRISYGSNLSQRMQYNELVDKDNLQRAAPESRNTRNFSLSSELDAEDVYNPMLSPLSI